MLVKLIKKVGDGDMKYETRWEIIDALDEGGQGKVYRVIDKSKYNLITIIKDIYESLHWIKMGPKDKQANQYESLRHNIYKLVQSESTSNHGALKVLHQPGDARDYNLAEKRIKNEIEAMSKLNHPNLIRILDADPDEKWFVSKFYPNKTLADSPNMYVGDFIGTLRAIRPLVEGVSRLHIDKIVHRDIKPKNIFLDENNKLVLGDFGLVFFVDSTHTRISETYENVGTRDFMPGWAYGMKIDQLSFSFDVFSLGKTIWSMVSGKPVLQLWYYDKPQFDVEKMFPTAPGIQLANEFFSKCIVEHEKDCIAYAPTLLDEIDRILRIHDNYGQPFNPDSKWRCVVCHEGLYKLVLHHSDSVESHNFGFRPAGGQTFQAYTCSHCGHLQLFAFDRQNIPEIWQK